MASEKILSQDKVKGGKEKQIGFGIMCLWASVKERGWEKLTNLHWSVLNEQETAAVK